MDAIQKTSQTWGGKRNPGALNGKNTLKQLKPKITIYIYTFLYTVSDSYRLLPVSSG